MSTEGESSDRNGRKGRGKYVHPTHCNNSLGDQKDLQIKARMLQKQEDTKCLHNFVIVHKLNSCLTNAPPRSASLCRVESLRLLEMG